MTQEELKLLEELEIVRKKNFLACEAVAGYLNEFPTLVTRDIMKEIGAQLDRDEERAFAIFLANALSDDEEIIKILEKDFFRKSIKKLNVEDYKSDPYYNNIKIPTKKLKSWSLGYQSYKPYEGFIYKDITVEKDYLEVPQIGFFSETFSFPTVFENGVEWMAIKPNEIETMKPHIQKMVGDVCVFGLGMGYFAYMASQRELVSSVTIVERDENVIKLFEENILPQFPNKHKITIVKSDAFEFVIKNKNSEKFSHAFVDLWHDAGDGLPLYVRMKMLECEFPKTRFSYWIEDSILSLARWKIFGDSYKQIKEGKLDVSYKELLYSISNEGIKSKIKQLLAK